MDKNILIVRYRIGKTWISNGFLKNIFLFIHITKIPKVEIKLLYCFFENSS